MFSARTTTIGAMFALTLSFTAADPGSAASEIKVIAPNAVKHSVMELAAGWSKQTGVDVIFTWTGSEAIAKRIAEGEAHDLVITTSSGIDRLVSAGKLSAETKVDFARSAVAAAVRSGLPRPDVSSVEALKKSLLSANSIAISSGASGRYMENVFAKLGVADQVKGKIKQPPSGAQIGDLLVRGEAELGFQQVTELIDFPGVTYLGLLPPALQNYTVWSAALHINAADSTSARALARTLGSPTASESLRKSGLEPVGN